MRTWKSKCQKDLNNRNYTHNRAKQNGIGKHYLMAPKQY